MTNVITLDRGRNKISTILTELENEQQYKKDLIIHPEDLKMNMDGKIISTGGELLHHTTDWSIGQLASKIGVPARYLKKCPSSLQAINTNYWLGQVAKNEENPWLLRTMNKDNQFVRGFLSDKYAPFDDVEVFQILDKYFESMTNRDITINMWYRNDRGFHLRVLFEDLTTQVGTLPDGTPDVHKVGIHIENSEVGAKSIRVTPLIFRLVCSNGMMAWTKNSDMEAFTQRHIHLKHHEMYGRVAEAIGTAIKVGDETIDKLVQAREIKIENPLETIRKLAEKNKYSKKFTETLEKHYDIEKGDTAFAVIQAFTRASQELTTDRRVEVESDVGKMLNNFIA